MIQCHQLRYESNKLTGAQIKEYNKESPEKLMLISPPFTAKGILVSENLPFQAPDTHRPSGTFHGPRRSACTIELQ